MKKILAIAWKDTRVRFTGWAEWVFFIVLPVLFTVILAGGTGGPADNRVRLVVIDQAHSPLSASLIAGLEKSEAIRPDVLSPEAADSQFNQRQVSAVLVIPPEFDLAHLMQASVRLDLRQQSNDVNALVAQRAIQAVAGQVSSSVEIANRSVEAAEKIMPFNSPAARQAYFEVALGQAQSLLDQAPQRVIEAKAATQDQVTYDPRANSSAGQLITWVFIPLIGISAMFAAERQKGTLQRLLTTPTRRGTYLLGTIAGQVATALVQMLILVGFGIIVMKLNWGHSPAALAVILVASALAAAALGTALGTWIKTESQANSLSVMAGMVMALLGGCWYPLELFPELIRNLVKVLPTTWAMQGMLAIVLRGQGLQAVLPSALVLLGFAVVFFSVGVWRFRYE